MSSFLSKFFVGYVVRQPTLTGCSFPSCPGHIDLILTMGFLPRIIVFLPALKRGEDCRPHSANQLTGTKFGAHSRTLDILALQNEKSSSYESYTVVQK